MLRAVILCILWFRLLFNYAMRTSFNSRRLTFVDNFFLSIMSIYQSCLLRLDHKYIGSSRTIYLPWKLILMNDTDLIGVFLWLTSKLNQRLINIRLQWVVQRWFHHFSVNIVECCAHCSWSLSKITRLKPHYFINTLVIITWSISRLKYSVLNWPRRCF